MARARAAAARVRRRSSSASTSSRSTSASRAACSSRSPRSARGFTADEPLESLGERLSLPPDFEGIREQVEPADADQEPARDVVSYVEREAEGEPEGTIVLFHGRGADEHDLAPLLDVLDPERRFRGITPRGPLSLPPGGAHWYAVREVGYPDPATFHATYGEVTEWLDGSSSTGADAARRLLAGRCDELRALARRRSSASGVGARAERVRPDRRGLRARPRPAAPTHRDRARDVRPGDRCGSGAGARRRCSRRRAPSCSTASTARRTRSTRASCSRRATTSSIGFEQRVHDVVARDAVLLDPRSEHTLAPEAGLLGDPLRGEVLDVRVELKPPVAAREGPSGHERERA